MLDLWTRDVKEKLYQPVIRCFARVDPNAITLLSLLPGLLCALAAAEGQSGLALALWVLNRVLDGLDGVVARQFGKATDFGGYLDIVVDFTVYAAIPIGVTLNTPTQTRWRLLSFLLSTYFVNAGGLFMLASILEKKNLGSGKKGEKTTVTMPVGLIEGTETVVFYSLWLLFPASADVLFLVFALLVSFTILQRVVWASQHL